MKQSIKFTVVIMRTACHLDWLSFTLPHGAPWQSFIPCADWIPAGKGHHGYRARWIDAASQTEVQSASGNIAMGIHVTMSGRSLWAWSEVYGSTDDTLVSRVMSMDGRVSRVDFALDIMGATVSPATLHADLEHRRAHICARTWRFIEGHRRGIQGDTLDTGAPTSERRLRFYDKRAEQGIKDGEAWVRLEMQLRNLYARATFGACAEHTTALVTRSVIGDYLMWDNAEYKQAIAGDCAEIPTIPRSVSNRQKWLLDQVAVALAAECIIDPYFRETFNQAVNSVIKRKLAENKKRV